MCALGRGSIASWAGVDSCARPTILCASLHAGVAVWPHREGLAAGESVQVMPCSSAHAFHPPCLKQWLQKHNSCPICRHELPTDDERAPCL